MAKRKVTIGPQRAERRAPATTAASRTHVYASAPTHTGAPLPAPTPYEVGGVGVREHAGLREAGPSSNSVADLMTSASALSAADKKELLARLSLDVSGLDGQERDQDMWAGSVYEALVAHAGGTGRESVGPMVIKRLVTPPSAWRPVADFMASSRLDTLTVVERKSFYTLLARLVVAYAAEVNQRSGAPLTAKLVVSCSANVRAVFDNSFPGYVANGLAVVVARRLTRARASDA